MLSKRKGKRYKLQPKTCEPRPFQMIYSKRPQSPSFSAWRGTKGALFGTLNPSQKQVYGLGWVNVKVVQWTCSFLCVKFAGREFKTSFGWWMMIISQGFWRYYTSRLSSCLQNIFYVKKFLRMINKSSLTERRLNTIMNEAPPHVNACGLLLTLGILISITMPWTHCSAPCLPNETAVEASMSNTASKASWNIHRVPFFPSNAQFLRAPSSRLALRDM